MMKLTQIALAVASLAAAPAFSATLDSLYGVGSGTAERIVYISGASALSGSLAGAVADLCNGGATKVRTFAIGTGTSVSDGRVVVCTTTSLVSGSPFSAAFAVIKRDVNGSFDGVGPVVNQSNGHDHATNLYNSNSLGVINNLGDGSLLTKWADKGNCTVTNALATGATIAGNCLLSTAAIKPHAGLTDVDYNVWKGLFNTGALSIPVHDKLAGTEGNIGGAFAGQGFGVMVTDKLYRAMQLKQVTEARLPQECGATLSSIGSFDPAYTPGKCQPSISKEEYSSMVNGNAGGAYSVTGALTPAGDTGVVNLCRRVETSGTQAASNVYFLHNSCANAEPTKGFKAPLFVDLVNGANPKVFSSSAPANNAVTGNYDNFNGAFALFEGSGTGDARNCMIRRNLGLNPNNVADTDSSGVAVTTLGNYAIGWISLENTPPASSATVVGGWKLVKLDGISPNATVNTADLAIDVNGGWDPDTTQRRNVVKGYYDAAPELEILWPSSNSTAFKTFLTNLKTTFANPVPSADLIGVFQANGYIVNGVPNTHAAFLNQVHKGTRGGNFCAPQLLAE